MNTDEVIADLRGEAAEDFVGLWKVFRLLRDMNPDHALQIGDVVQVVHALLSNPQMQIGQFSGKIFKAWPGTLEDRISRLDRELRVLGHEPGLGEVAWLVEE